MSKNGSIVSFYYPGIALQGMEIKIIKLINTVKNIKENLFFSGIMVDIMHLHGINIGAYQKKHYSLVTN